MKIRFSKYQGTGNDFVMIDNRDGSVSHGPELAARLCDRKFGIGADGLILLETSDTVDFDMIYYNADGSQSFCGNGSRCVVRFASSLGLIDHEATFTAIDGTHQARIEDGIVHLKMNDVADYERGDSYYFIDTGSPHYILYVDDLQEVDIVKEAQKIRYNDRFKEEGTNVNFVQRTPQGLKLRTYERGVEGETLSCGTGVTAVALSGAIGDGMKDLVKLESMGGSLEVRFARNGNGFTDIWLSGPAEEVFVGEVAL